MKSIFITDSENATEALGEKFGASVKPQAVIAFYGGLGVGKTSFIRGLARGMGLASRVTSPTFTIVNEYLGAVPLFHFDMYRLASSEELFEIGWDDYLTRNGVIAVEWSENVEDSLPNNTIRITITRLSDSEREIVINQEE